MKSTALAPPSLRFAILSRAAAAVFGGYAFASVCTVLLSFLLPLPVVEAVLAASLFSFAIHTAAAIWVFAAPTAVRAWLGLLVPGLALGLACAALHLLEVRA